MQKKNKQQQQQQKNTFLTSVAIYRRKLKFRGRSQRGSWVLDSLPRMRFLKIVMADSVLSNNTACRSRVQPLVLSIYLVLSALSQNIDRDDQRMPSGKVRQLLCVRSFLLFRCYVAVSRKWIEKFKLIKSLICHQNDVAVSSFLIFYYSLYIRSFFKKIFVLLPGIFTCIIGCKEECSCKNRT